VATHPDLISRYSNHDGRSFQTNNERLACGCGKGGGHFTVSSGTDTGSLSASTEMRETDDDDINNRLIIQYLYGTESSSKADVRHVTKIFPTFYVTRSFIMFSPESATGPVLS
jgi:hypothetical protein